MVVGGCSWLASCCWVVVPGWQWLWFVPLIGLWDVHGGNRWLLRVIGFGVWWSLVVYCNRYIILL